MEQASVSVTEVYSPMKCVEHERVKQDTKWGIQNHSDEKWLAILTEELGEVAECVCHTAIGSKDEAERRSFDALMDYELVQVAAVAVAWLECRKRNRKNCSA